MNLLHSQQACIAVRFSLSLPGTDLQYTQSKRASNAQTPFFARRDRAGPLAGLVLPLLRVISSQGAARRRRRRNAFWLGPWGIVRPGRSTCCRVRAFSSLDFIDAHHLLFTFHQPRLMRREQNPDRFDDDQVIQAVVLGLPGGTVLASSEWRMHDRSEVFVATGRRQVSGAPEEYLFAHRRIVEAAPVHRSAHSGTRTRKCRRMAASW